MVYLENTQNPQSVWIPRNDGNGYIHTVPTYQEGYEDGMEYQKSLLSSTAITENGNYQSENGWSAITVNVEPTLENGNLVVSQDITVVVPSSGYDGFSAVTVDATNYGQTNYDNGFEDGFTDGYSSGSSEGYDSGYTEGYQSGSTDGYDSGYTSGNTDGYNSGYTEGEQQGIIEGEQNIINTFSAFTATTNGQYGSSANPYSSVTVNVAQTGHTDQEMENAFNSGYTSGETHQKSLLGTTAFTINGSYSAENGYSAITVNVPTGQTYNIEQNKPFTATSNGNYTITPTNASTTVTDHFDRDSDRYYLTATTSGYPSTDYFELFLIEDEFDSSKGSIEVYFDDGRLDCDVSDWYGGFVDFDNYGNELELVVYDANNGFGYTMLSDFNYGYDVMSAVTLTVDVPQSSGSTEKEIIICTNGDCWFVTNVPLNNGDTIEIEHCTFGKYGAVQFYHQQFISGNLSDELRIGQSEQEVIYIKYFDSRDTLIIPLPQTGTCFDDNTIVFSPTAFTIDGQVIETYNGGGADNGELIIFANDEYGGDGIYDQTAKIGKITIYDSNGDVKATLEPRLDEFYVPYFKYIEQDIDIYASGNTAPFYEEIIIDQSYQSGYTSGRTDGRNSVLLFGGNFGYSDNGTYSMSASDYTYTMCASSAQTGSNYTYYYFYCYKYFQPPFEKTLMFTINETGTTNNLNVYVEADGSFTFRSSGLTFSSSGRTAQSDSFDGYMYYVRVGRHSSFLKKYSYRHSNSGTTQSQNNYAYIYADAFSSVTITVDVPQRCNGQSLVFDHNINNQTEVYTDTTNKYYIGNGYTTIVRFHKNNDGDTQSGVTWFYVSDLGQDGYTYNGFSIGAINYVIDAKDDDGNTHTGHYDVWNDFTQSPTWYGWETCEICLRYDQSVCDYIVTYNTEYPYSVSQITSSVTVPNQIENAYGLKVGVGNGRGLVGLESIKTYDFNNNLIGYVVYDPSTNMLTDLMDDTVDFFVSGGTEADLYGQYL